MRAEIAKLRLYKILNCLIERFVKKDYIIVTSAAIKLLNIS
jgi:hypothetical protein